MAKTTDDLEAVRTVTTALAGFGPDEQERILRWAREKLGLALTARTGPDLRTPEVPKFSHARPGQLADAPQPPPSGKDLKTFVTAKNPKSDVQFAATVAYFYRFEALPEQRRNEIDASTLQDGCRLAGRARLKDPLKTLNNAKGLGLLDSGGEKGRFTINTVGENLVAMTLPGQTDDSAKKKSPRPKRVTRKMANKKK